MYQNQQRIKKHYLPLSILSLFSAFIFYEVWNKLDTITFIADATAYISLILLAASLLTGPINLYLKRNNPVSSYFRRDLGIYAGILALIHSLTGLFVHLRGNMWQYFLIKTEQGYAIRLDDFGWANYTGIISSILILLLLITSNDFSMRKLNPFKWKNIQRLSYFMFLIALLHSIYYRIVADNPARIYFLYLPLLVIVLSFQSAGFWLKIRSKKITATGSSS